VAAAAEIKSQHRRRRRRRRRRSSAVGSAALPDVAPRSQRALRPDAARSSQGAFLPDVAPSSRVAASCCRPSLVVTIAGPLPGAGRIWAVCASAVSPRGCSSVSIASARTLCPNRSGSSFWRQPLLSCPSHPAVSTSRQQFVESASSSGPDPGPWVFAQKKGGAQRRRRQGIHLPNIHPSHRGPGLVQTLRVCFWSQKLP
jgi:hypothetical protein